MSLCNGSNDFCLTAEATLSLSEINLTPIGSKTSPV